jgi:hypothetical protein
MAMHAVVADALRQGERTVPELAEALCAPVAEVMVWLMGMRRYGLVVESAEANDDDYFTYRLAGAREVQAP